MRTFTTENKTIDDNLELNQVKSIYDRIDDFSILKNGEVLHNLFEWKN